jgi:hypothetical protein
MAKVVENSFHSTKYLESLEEKDFHDTWRSDLFVFKI